MQASYTVHFTHATQGGADGARDAFRAWLLDTGAEDEMTAYAEGENFELLAGAETGTSRAYAVTL